MKRIHRWPARTAWSIAWRAARGMGLPLESIEADYPGIYRAALLMAVSR